MSPEDAGPDDRTPFRRPEETPTVLLRDDTPPPEPVAPQLAPGTVLGERLPHAPAAEGGHDAREIWGVEICDSGTLRAGRTHRRLNGRIECATILVTRLPSLTGGDILQPSLTQ